MWDGSIGRRIASPDHENMGKIRTLRTKIRPRPSFNPEIAGT
jgi:hypothetical protein